MNKKESEIERYVCKELHHRGYITKKITAEDQTGWPDRMVLCPNGRVFFIEFKTTYGVLSARQKLIIDQLQQYGYHVEVLRSDTTKDIVEMLRRVQDVHHMETVAISEVLPDVPKEA